MRNDHSKNPIIQLSVEFSLMVIDYAEQLDKKEKHLVAKEILKCGVSIGAHIMDAQSAEDVEDYVHKMKIADKAAHETWYWFYLCEQSDQYQFNKELAKKLDEILQLLNKAIMSGKRA